MSLHDWIVNALKGFGMGAANVVPGVSGGTIALLTGIYSRIIDCLDAVASLDTWKLLLHGKLSEFWKRIDGNFLVALAIGVVVSVFSLATLMTTAMERWPIFTWAFFFGLILASAFFMLRDIKGWKVSWVLLLLAGIGLGIAVCTLTPAHIEGSMPFYFVCGMLSVCSMILPGISGSFVLVILDQYDDIMLAISTLDIPVLAVFAAGCVVGLLAFAKLLHFLMARWEKQTLLVLIGFVLGSLVKVWPWSDPSVIVDGQLHVIGAILWCVAGAALVIILETVSSKSKE